MFAQVRDGGADGNFVDDAQRGEVDDGEGAVGSGDIGVEMEIGAEDGGAMLAEQDDESEDEQESEQEVDTEVFAMGHEENE